MNAFEAEKGVVIPNNGISPLSVIAGFLPHHSVQPFETGRTIFHTRCNHTLYGPFQEHLGLKNTVVSSVVIYAYVTYWLKAY